ncbi:isoprenoid synthase domain-containing protein [Boletus edulis]|uniref:Terpene synthase n=1 Tax=Boletus edulis BED1 TaxID=1328754 RepID=A0AAD4BSF9_BOLED|nr:isoprenoid synthase domain-containing protein [Boletus edulis]KAF8438993.1 terpenoid synthase [Boletus edulis BED1]
MSPAPSTSRLAPTAIRIPDLVSHCTFELHIDRNHKLVSAESKKWLFNGDPDLDEAAFHGLEAGKLISMCYYNAGYPQLRVCTDFSNYLFHLDNLSDDMDDRGIDNVANVVMNTIHHPHTYHSSARLNRMTKDFYKRIMQTASPGTCRRFKETMKLYFQAIQQQALDRANGTIPDLESYITLRRDTSGCKPSWVLIEYAYHLNIPDEVMDHPIICGIGEATNDFVAWSNDIFSYDVEQSKDQTHNMIDVIMHEQGLGLQDAIDLVGDYCKHALDRFVHDRDNLPSWGPAIDADVRVYVDGLTRWMVGSLHWSFETERYFGKVGKQIKATRLVNLRRKAVHAQVRV